MKTIIYTSFDCLLKSENESLALDRNEYASFDDFPSKLFVYPTGKTHRIPFEIYLHSPCPFYRVIEKKEKRLIFLLDGIIAENIEKHEFSFEGRRSEIEISSKKIIFSSRNKKKVLTLPAGACQFECGNFHHINYVLFSLPEQQCLAAFNTSSGGAKVFYGQKIELASSGFTIIKEEENSKQTFIVDREGLKIKESSHSSSVLSISKNLLPLRFLELLQEHDFSSALSLLAPNLLSCQNESSLKSFFGEISYIYPLDPLTIFTISNGENKIFYFTIENNKISDISNEEEI